MTSSVAKWVDTECDCGHLLLVGLDEEGIIVAVSQRGTVWSFDREVFCPRCGDEIRTIDS